MQTDFKKIIEFIRNQFNADGFIPLHEPRFWGNEKKYVADCIETSFVSSVGKYVNRFEKITAEYTGAKYAIATVNGTAALHIALLLSGVKTGDEVITQPLSFVATANAIKHANANPVFIDVDKDTMGLSPEKLEHFLTHNTYLNKNNQCINTKTKRHIAACVPMHTFGFPCRIEDIHDVCRKYNITLIEDAAEALGAYYKGQHCGTFGQFGTLSYNGNKTITSGSGGMILTNDEKLATKAKHITTTAKLPHQWEYEHDMVAYNYRLSNMNAALGCAQMENLSTFLELKRNLAEHYKTFFRNFEITFISEPENTNANYWLNTILLKDKKQRDDFLDYSNSKGIMTRPAWKLLNTLQMYKNYQSSDLSNAIFLADRIVNLPSSPVIT